MRLATIEILAARPALIVIVKSRTAAASGIGTAIAFIAVTRALFVALIAALATACRVFGAILAFAATGVIVAEPTRYFVARTIEKAAIIAARTVKSVIVAARRIKLSAAAFIASVSHGDAPLE